MDMKTAAHLNQIHGKNMAWVKGRRAELRARQAEIDAREAVDGETEHTRADRLEVTEQYAALNEFLEHGKPKFDPLAEQPVRKATFSYKAWFVLAPLIIWPVVCWLGGAFLLITGGTVVAVSAGDEEAGLALLERLAPYAHHGVYLGLLIGGVKAFRRMSVSRERLYRRWRGWDWK